MRIYLVHGRSPLRFPTGAFRSGVSLKMDRRSQRGQNHAWTERQGRWIILNGQCCHLILYFNYRGAGFARRIASVSLNRDALFLEGFDYRERQIRMHPVAARRTGHDNEVSNPAWVLNVLFGRFDRWPRL